jgi:AbrB family looped-hinge helix DNA binding protein
MKVRLSTHGRLVIPAGLRRKYGLQPGQVLRLIDTSEGLLLKPFSGQTVLALQGSLKGSGALKLLLAERTRESGNEIGRQEYEQ